MKEDSTMKKIFPPLAVAMILYLALAFQALANDNDGILPPEFVRVAEVTQEVLLEIRYYSAYNFVGSRIDGYQAPVAILSASAAEALKKAAAASRNEGYILKIFDAYRPQRAVNHFIRWAKDLSAVENKAVFYPDVEKSRLFELGYIAERSGHSRGSTLDLTLVERASGQELDMGSPFDFFGPISHHDTALITPQQTVNRERLRAIMVAAGFKPYQEEWWHYTLVDEPYPDHYFDFVVK
jgi:D-alanyl-D-alanine dipeptidase